MQISIVVPIYNEERHIARCVEALLAQEYPPDQYEIIMVDNNSTDHSAEIVKRYPAVQLLSEPQQGDFAARNRGIEVATGEIIAFTDSDTAPFPDWLENIARIMRDPGVGVIVGNLQYPKKARLLSMIGAYEAERSACVFASDTKEIYYGHTCNMAVRKRLFDRLGLFPAIFRNSDAVFVRRVVDEYSCRAVCYSFDVRVQRLEISSLWKYYSKLHMYGRDFQRFGEVASFRPLSRMERFQFLKSMIERKRHSLIKSVFLWPFLFVGNLCYELGRRRGV